MLDKNIPYCNIIMKYIGPAINSEPSIDIKGYHYSTYCNDDNKRWAQMEVDNNDFDTYSNAYSYFNNKYLAKEEKLKKSFIGIRNDNDYLVGSIMCWNDIKNNHLVNSLHWLIVDPQYQELGIGKKLVDALLFYASKNQLFPIYLHSQPWSYKAIGIYSSKGFKITKSDTFKNYSNDYDIAIKILENYMPKEKWHKLINESIE